MKLSSFAFLAVLTFALASCQLATQLGISSSPSASPTPTPTPAPSGAISDYATRIPDVHLRAALEQAVGGGKTFGSITYADLAAVTWVSGTGAGTDGITNLKGIELCTGLTGVFLLFENVSDLTPLASLPNLKQIWAQDNHISDLSPVAGLSQLEALVVADNPIPLAQLNGISKSRYPHLKAIGLGSSTIPTSFAQASSIVSPFASQLTTLTLFHLSGGDAGFSGLWTSTLSVAGANLVFLNLIDDGLSEASITGKISTLTNLSFLYLQGNALTTIGGLSSLTHLTDVNLAYNQISDLTPLGTLYDAGAFRKADWAEGIYLDVRGNGMDLTTGSANETVVQKLVNSGVRVDWQTGNTTTTASLTVTSPVGTKLYGLANSASFTLPLPLTYTTNQASVEYQLNNSGTWVSASSGTNLWGSSIRPGINHLAVQAKDASGTVTATTTVDFVQWTPSSNLSPSQAAAGNVATNWLSGSATVGQAWTVGGSSGTPQVYQTDNASAYTIAGGGLTAKNQTVFDAATNPTGPFAQLSVFPVISGTIPPTGLLAVRSLFSFGDAPASSSANDNTTALVGIAGYANSFAGGVLAFLTKGHDGLVWLGVMDTETDTGTNVTTNVADGTTAVPALDFSVPSGTMASESGARYALALLKDGSDYYAGLADLGSVTLDGNGNPTDVPTLVAATPAVNFTLGHPGSYNGIGLADKNTTSTATTTESLFASWY